MQSITYPDVMCIKVQRYLKPETQFKLMISIKNFLHKKTQQNKTNKKPQLIN